MLGFSHMGCLPLNWVGWVEVRNPTILIRASTQPTKLAAVQASGNAYMKLHL
jgi:hypothetical protein